MLAFILVEKPIRFDWQFRYKTAVLVLAMLAIGALGYSANKTDGFPERPIMKEQKVVNAGDISHDAFANYYGEHFFICADPVIQKDAGNWKGLVRCFQSHSSGPVTLLMLGDSHAEHLFLGVAEQLPHENVGFYGKGALPFISKDEFTLIFDRVLHNTDIKKVVITAMWAGRMNEVVKGSTLASELIRTIQALQASGKKVYLSDDIPKFGFDPQRCKFHRPLTQSTKCDEPKENLDSQRDKYLSDLQEVVRLTQGVEWIEISSLMCSGETCSMARDGQLLYRDNNHLNIPGSQFVGAQIVSKHPGLAR
jgi:SGNH domain (fused to AT3 domains)